MPYIQNPLQQQANLDGGGGYGSAPYANLGNIGANLGQALFGSPQMMAAGQINRAQLAQMQAETEGQNEKNAAYQQQQDAVSNLAPALQSAFTVKNPDGSTRVATPAEYLPKLGDTFKTIFQAGDGNGENSAALTRAFIPFLNNEDLSRDSAVAAGEATGPQFAATTGRADQLTATEAANALKQTTAAENIRAGATLGAANIDQAGANSRQTQLLAHEDANPTTAVVAGRVLNTLATDPASAAKYGIPATDAPRMIESVVAPWMVRSDSAQAVANTKGNTALTVGQGHDAARVQAANIEATGRTPTVTAPVQNQISTGIDQLLSDNNMNLDPTAKIAVTSRASQLFQTPGTPAYRNPVVAIQQATQELMSASPPDTRGVIGHLFSAPTYGLPAGYGGTLTPPGQGGAGGATGAAPTGAAPTPAAPAPAAPASSVPSGLPAISTPQDYQALPAGARYVDPNGVQRIKGGA